MASGHGKQCKQSNHSNMSKIISICNHKGGVGKTTTCINIGTGLSNMGKDVLLIDLDPQSNLTESLGIQSAEMTIYGALREDYRLTPVSLAENLGIVPSTLDLSAAEIELSSEAGREVILREILEPIKDEYDFIFVDCPPALGLLTVNALTASDEVYLTIQAQYLALRGLTKLLEVIEKVKRRLNSSLHIGGVLITQYDGRKILNRNVAESIRRYFGDRVFNTVIRDNVALAEAPSSGEDIHRYNPKSHGAEDYSELCREILSKHHNQSNHSKQDNIS